ncbi:MAG: sigma-70 family RNA polymerase sigma factor [Polyangiaceae bacterium]|nr:sigma-70 family RNA polymerase sigma factor [Polyangiaceae bacterium]
MTEPRGPQSPELLLRVAEGDTAAQDCLVALVRRRVHTIALAIMGHAADAEDTTQCALVEILGSAHTYRGGSLYAWADRIAVRTAARHARKRRVRAARIDVSADPEHSGTDSAPPARDEAIARPILEYLSELPEARRTVLVLRHVMGYCIDEIAELTATSPNTVKDRLLQARRQVRRSIRRDLVCLPASTRSSR